MLYYIIIFSDYSFIKVSSVIVDSMEIETVEGRLVRLQTRDKVRIEGFLIGTRNEACMIYVHGMFGNFYRSTLPFSLARKLSRNGVPVFILNTRGHDAVAVLKKGRGERLIAGTDLERFEDSVFDIDAAIVALKQMGFKKFVLVGHSTGCQKVTYYQYKKKRREVIGVLLLAPADDYAIYRKELGSGFAAKIRLAKALVKKGHGDTVTHLMPSHFSPRRFLSLADLRNQEARVFNYDGKMHGFSSVKVPVCAVFGSREEYACKPVVEYMEILKRKNNSKSFLGVVVDDADHSFSGREDFLAGFASKWALNLRSGKALPTGILELNSRFPLASVL